MSANLVGASGNYLATTFGAAPLVPNYAVGYPMSFGMWIWLNAVGTVARTLWSFSDNNTAHYLSVRMTSAEVLQIVARAGGAESVATSTATLPARQWCYVIGRFISATNRILHVRTPTGLTSNQDTVSTTPSNLVWMSLGVLAASATATEPWDGKIAEYWLAIDDCFPGVTTTAVDALIMKMAYGGPFAFPTLGGDLIDYRSFRKGPGSFGSEDRAELGDWQKSMTWQCINTPSVHPSDHPPLPYWYAKPPKASRLIVT